MNNKIFRQCKECQISERQWGRIAVPSVIFRESGLQVCLKKKKKRNIPNQKTPKQQQKNHWKVLGNLKSLTWLKSEEWKS